MTSDNPLIQFSTSGFNKCHAFRFARDFPSYTRLWGSAERRWQLTGRIQGSKGNGDTRSCQTITSHPRNVKLCNLEKNSEWIVLLIYNSFMPNYSISLIMKNNSKSIYIIWDTLYRVLEIQTILCQQVFSVISGVTIFSCKQSSVLKLTGWPVTK